MMSPPAKAHGRLLSRAMAAAAAATMMMRVRFSTTMPVSGAMRMPARPAVMAPSAQADTLITEGRAPVRPARSRLSTTARIEMPSRVR